MAAVGAVARGALAAPRPHLARAMRASFRWLLRENVVLFTLVFAAGIALAVYLVYTVNYNAGDANARVANAYYILFSRDPHLAAIGFVWPPLPSLLDLPLLALKGWFPPLAERAIAGGIETSAFAAGTAVLLNTALRQSRVAPPIRWLVIAAYVANPMIALYAANGMTESMFIFFLVAATLYLVRWAEEGDGSALVRAGVFTALGALVRYEMWPVGIAMAGIVVMCSWRRARSWREAETNLFVYALPVLMAIGLWVGCNAAIKHDALFFIHSNYITGQPEYAGQTLAASVRHFPEAERFLGTEILLLSPLAPVMALLVAIAGIRRGHRRGAFALLASGMPVLAFHLYLIHVGGSQLWLRFFITVIPFTYLMLAHLLGQVRYSVFRHTLCLIATALLAAANIVTGLAMVDPLRGREENEVMTAALARHQVPDTSVYARQAAARRIAEEIADLDRDHSLIATDSFSTFQIILSAPDPTIYVVTSDEDFEAAASAPLLYNVRYLLITDPVGYGTQDFIDRLYPGLWSNGGGFAKLVKDFGVFRLFEVIGPTGR